MRWWGWLLVSLAALAVLVIGWVALSASSIVSRGTTYTEGLAMLGSAIDSATGFWSWAYAQLWPKKAASK